MEVLSVKAEGKVVLLTGGYGHLGRGIAQNLAAHGAVVYVLGRSQSKFEEAFKDSEGNIHFQYCDISDEDSFNEAVGKVDERENKIDALINNAFYLEGQNPEKIDDLEWSKSIDGTLNNVYRSIKSILPIFRKYKEGRIINVASMYGLIAPDFKVYEKHKQYLNPPHYGAGKAGVIQLTKYFASYLGNELINVNSVSPGPFPSDSVQENVEFISELKKKTALGKIGVPEEIGGIFTFLVSDSSRYVTGQNFIIDGGWTIKS